MALHQTYVSQPTVSFGVLKIGLSVVQTQLNSFFSVSVCFFFIISISPRVISR